MLTIERLQLTNFKSIAHIDLELKPLNVLIGRNGSGKSNLLAFFRLLQQGADGRLNATLNQMGGVEEVLYYGATERRFRSEIVFKGATRTGTDQNDSMTYRLEVATVGATTYSIQLEELERPPFAGYDENYKFLSGGGGRVRILKATDRAESRDFDASDRELLITQIRDRVRYPSLDELQSTLSDWQIFHGFGKQELEPIRAGELLNPQSPLRLDPSGTNLVSVLQTLANEPQYEDAYARLVGLMQLIMPDFVKFDVQIVAGGRAALNFRSRHFNRRIPALSLSDGILRFLGLAILLLLPEPPPLIVIDEPEIGLHPEMIPIFGELLQYAAERTQIIVATHSPRLIDFVPPESVIVTERENGETTLRRLEIDPLQRWLERYTLGNLWRMGKIERSPEPLESR
ncbi:MAG: AAA family ATPase [Phototrophicaceae bacterium]|jgi:predicted ATPase